MYTYNSIYISTYVYIYINNSKIKTSHRPKTDYDDALGHSPKDDKHESRRHLTEACTKINPLGCSMESDRNRLLRVELEYDHNRCCNDVDADANLMSGLHFVFCLLLFWSSELFLTDNNQKAEVRLVSGQII